MFRRICGNGRAAVWQGQNRRRVWGGTEKIWRHDRRVSPSEDTERAWTERRVQE